uniref:Uncharacterized protein n=1 Tax=Romanomermis culicivorax TaxID=13658 RepID=A0A915HL44_ROMCU
MPLVEPDVEPPDVVGGPSIGFFIFFVVLVDIVIFRFFLQQVAAKTIQNVTSLKENQMTCKEIDTKYDSKRIFRNAHFHSKMGFKCPTFQENKILLNTKNPEVEIFGLQSTYHFLSPINLPGSMIGKSSVNLEIDEKHDQQGYIERAGGRIERISRQFQKLAMTGMSFDIDKIVAFFRILPPTQERRQRNQAR